MSDLQFVAISDDGKMIILQTPNGEWIEVPFDASLVAPTRLPVEAPTRSEELIELSPREIQARVRAGVPVEELARISGSSDERIMSFAAPILMERQHVALRAGRTIIRRASGAGPLSDIIEARLDPHGVVPADIEWDSFRREDGRWTVIVRYPSKDGEREAHWLFDVRNSALVPADDEARWLVGEVPANRSAATAQAETVAITAPHLVALPTPKEPHLPEIRESQVIKREVPLQAVPTQTAQPTPVPATPPVSVTQVVRLDEAPVSFESAGANERTEDIQDSLFIADETIVIEEESNPTQPNPIVTEAAAQEYRRHTQIFERPTVPPEQRPVFDVANSWAEEREEFVETQSPAFEAPSFEEAGAEIASFEPSATTEAPPALREIEFEEPTPPARETTVEVKKSRAPSWDEILFGGGDSSDEPF